MRQLSGHPSSQKKSAQEARAIGKANNTPRAKPRYLGFRSRRPRGLEEVENSSLLILLSILAIDLLLLAERFHRGIGGVINRAQNSLKARQAPATKQLRPPRTRPVKKPGFGKKVGQELGDLVFIICLALVPKRRKSRSMYESISVRAGSEWRRHPGIVLRLAAFICMSLMVPRLALAEAPKVLTPIELFDPDSGEGVRISPGFVLYPQATLDLTYDSNIYNVDADEIEDGVVSLRPAFAIRSDFSRHAVSLEGAAEIRRYFDISDENSEQYRLASRALLELGYGIDVAANAGYNRGIERRGTAGDLFFSDGPILFHEKTAGIEVSRTGNRMGIALGANVVRRDYSETLRGGIPIDLSLRDVTVHAAKFRADYGLNAKTKIFGELSGNEIDYQTATIPSRDSGGFAALIGVKHELTALVDLEAGIGYIHQEFEDPSIKSVGEVNYRLAASWTPSPQWKLSASASRFVDPSRSQEAPAIITTEFKLGVQRAIGDRILVGAEAGYLVEDYKGSSRSDKRAFVSGSTTYRLADRVGVFVSVGYRDQDGGADGRSYKGFAGTVGLRAAW